jgi:aminopeptidase N
MFCKDGAMAGNITRDQAQRRSATISVDSYRVVLDLSGGAGTFESTTTATFTSHEPGAATWIDLLGATVRSVRCNGVDLDPGQVYDGERITLTELAASNVVEVVADCPYMNTGEGLHRFVDPVDGQTYLYTQFETADARRMYACFEQPDLKATFALTVTAPDHWHVVSNAAPLGDAQPAGAGTARWEFPPTPRISTYITALVAGPYHRVQDSYTGRFGTVPLGLYCRRSLAAHLDEEEIFALTKQGFAFFEDAFDIAYPFGKYDQLFVPEFNAGAMENAGCVTFLEDYVFRSRVTRSAYEARANTILHEMAHMWFGDLVTMRWWDDLWLNESFAEWAAHHASVSATEFTDAWTSFANGRKAWAYRQDQLPSTHPIAADMVDLHAVETNFDGITYAKGASALKQLVAFVGQDAFLAGVRTYFRAFAWGSTTFDDLVAHLAAASGRDLSQWAAQWLQTSGVNLLRAQITGDADDRMTQVVVVQEPPASPPGLPAVLRDHRMRIGLFDEADGRLVRTGSVELDVAGARTEVPALAGLPRPALLLLNDGDLTYAKIRLDERSTGTAVAMLGRLDDPLARSLIWGAAWDMTRDAELTTGAFVDLVINAMPGETDISVVQNVLRQARTAVDAYAAPEHAPGYRIRLAAALRGWMVAAAPGSDRQLALVRAFAGFATTQAELDDVEGILDGSFVLDGLAVDADLRWGLLARLAVVGRADAESIDAELARDATAAGQRQHLLCLAARPTAEAKAAAWTACVERADLANAMLDAALAGFVQPEQAELLRPYRDRYFAALPALWQERTYDMASSITLMLFPYHLVEQASLDAADAFLAGEAHPGAARLVAEGRDTVARSLRARQADAGA